MKRCNNCGWFNLDSAVCCEKCEDESLEIVVESPSVTKSDDDTKPESETKAPKDLGAVNDGVVLQSVDSAPNMESNPEQEPVSVKNDFKATVVFGANTPMSGNVKDHSNVSERRGLAATIMDASVLTESKSCPKCRYPLSGYVEYCPNCGATISNHKATIKSDVCQFDDNNAVSRVTVPIEDEKVKQPAKPVPSVNLKATVRDIPESLVSDPSKCYKLVSEDGVGEAEIELILDEIVVIAGRKYKFQKK